MKLKSTIFTKCLRTLYKINMDKSNEVHVALIEALYTIFVEVKDDVNQANLEMCLKTATGVWLDAWGSYFYIPREAGELDQPYADRIIAEVIEPKVTVDALKRATARWLNRKNGDSWKPDDIVLYEPWTGLMKLSHRGTLSASARLWSPDYWTHCVLDVQLPDATELTAELIAYLKTIKAAGVQLIWSITAGNWEVLTGYFTADKTIGEHSRQLFLEVNDHNDAEGFRLADGTKWLNYTYKFPLFPYTIDKLYELFGEDAVGEVFKGQTIGDIFKKYGGGTIYDLVGLFEGKTVQTLTVAEITEYMNKNYKVLIDSLYESLLSGDNYTKNWLKLYDSIYKETITQFVNRFEGETPQTLTMEDIKKKQWELYNSKVIDMESYNKKVRKYRLSGNYTIWRLYTRQHWLHTTWQHSIRNYRNSETVKLKDYELLFRKPLEEITLQEFYNREFEDGAAFKHTVLNLPNSTVKDILYFFPNKDTSSLTIGQIYQLDDTMVEGDILVPGTNSTHNSYCEDRLAHVQGLFEYSQQDKYAQYYEQLRTVLTIDLAQSILGENVTLEDIENNKTLLVKELIEQGVITPISV